MNQKLHNRKYLKEYRKTLRNHMTFSEGRLWSCLKSKQLEGRKFRRQHSIGKYIVDFFCYAENLAIEVDGKSHDNFPSEESDDKKDRFLKENNIKILRFAAIDIKDNLDGVLREIVDNFSMDN